MGTLRRGRRSAYYGSERGSPPRAEFHGGAGGPSRPAAQQYAGLSGAKRPNSRGRQPYGDAPLRSAQGGERLADIALIRLLLRGSNVAFGSRRLSSSAWVAASSRSSASMRRRRLRSSRRTRPPAIQAAA